MSEKDIQSGYADAKAGLPCKSRKAEYVDGWDTYHDELYWRGLAAKVGAELQSFTGRYYAMFSYPGSGQYIGKHLAGELEGLDRPDSLNKAEGTQ